MSKLPIYNLLIYSFTHSLFYLPIGGGLGSSPLSPGLNITEKMNRTIAQAMKMMNKDDTDLVKMSLRSKSIISQMPNKDMMEKNSTRNVRIIADPFLKLLIVVAFWLSHITNNYPY